MLLYPRGRVYAFPRTGESVWFCVVPARGGSKRIPGKNLLVLGKLPLIAVTIRNLVGSGIFSEVYVSTDDDDIAKVASEHGAIVPFMRSPQLADDYTPTLAVLKDMLKKLDNIDNDDYVACVYPASVFIDTELLKTIKNDYKSNLDQGDFVISVKKFIHPVERALSINSDFRIKALYPNTTLSRTQDLNCLYHDAGQFYIAKKEVWLNSVSMFEQSVAFLLKDLKFLDIDSPEDFENLKTIYGLYRSDLQN